MRVGSGPLRSWEIPDYTLPIMRVLHQDVGDDTVVTLSPAELYSRHNACINIGFMEQDWMTFVLVEGYCQLCILCSFLIALGGSSVGVTEH